VSRGYFAIGVYQPKIPDNIGTLMRAAYLYGAAYVFTIGKRYERQATDTPNTAKHTPLFHYEDFSDFLHHRPDNAQIVGVELDHRSVSVENFSHPERAIYLLGAEDYGLRERQRHHCDHLIQIPTVKPQSMNVSAAGSIALYSRHVQMVR